MKFQFRRAREWTHLKARRVMRKGVTDHNGRNQSKSLGETLANHYEKFEKCWSVKTSQWKMQRLFYKSHLTEENRLGKWVTSCLSSGKWQDWALNLLSFPGQCSQGRDGGQWQEASVVAQLDSLLFWVHWGRSMPSQAKVTIARLSLFH